jgi:hypothetical protein
MQIAKYLFLIIILCGAQNTTWAQKTYQRESAYGNSTDNSLPAWAKEMYKPNPNLLLVKQLFESYYQTHPFVKNEHTQYYKRWVHAVQNMASLSKSNGPIHCQVEPGPKEL